MNFTLSFQLPAAQFSVLQSIHQQATAAAADDGLTLPTWPDWLNTVATELLGQWLDFWPAAALLTPIRACIRALVGLAVEPKLRS
jgi:hypothetical protein